MPCKPAVERMEIHELESNKMDALRMLAETNVKIGEARVALSALKEEEVEYLAERESKVRKQLDELLAESQSLVTVITSNYAEITSFHNTIASMASFVSQAQKDVHELMLGLAIHIDRWEERIKKEQEKVVFLKEEVELRSKELEQNNAILKKQQAELLKTERIINDKYQTLQRTQERLKND